MPFQPGHPKYGGRKKGVPNKASLKPLRQSLADQGFDLGREITTLLASENLRPDLRVKVLELVAKYTEAAPVPVVDTPAREVEVLDEVSEAELAAMVTDDPQS